MLKYIKGNRQTYVRYGNTMFVPAISVERGTILDDSKYSPEVIERLLSTGDFVQIHDKPKTTPKKQHKEQTEGGNTQ